MDIDVLQNTLLWAGLLNMALLLYWFVFIAFARNWVYRLHCRWYPISEEHFNCIHYSGMMAYKLAIFALFICPYLAILIAR